MEYPLISVIIPMYNVEAFLDRCMETVTKQEYKNLEIILVDDGSTDSTNKLASEWCERDGRIRLITKENGGQSAARNLAVKQARGEYITFVDSDDWLECDSISYLYDLLKKHDADFVTAEYVRPSTPGEINQAFSDIEEKVLSRNEFLDMFFKINTQVNMQYPWGKLFKCELVLNNPFPEGMTDEDVPTIFAIGCDSDRVVYSTKVVYDYFVNEDSTTESKFGERNFDLLKAWDLVLEIAEKKNCSADISEKAQFNRDRADFGILVNLAQSANYKRDKVTFAAEKKAALARLRKNYRKLLRGPIPKSRKVFILGFVISYPVTAWFINTVSNRNRR